MEMAKLFMNGKSQAVQPTMKFRFRGNKVLIKKIGDAVILLPYETADFDASSALTYGRVRAELEAKGTPICVLNTLIAAHALTLKVSLMTNNPCEFQRVNGLTVENWLSHFADAGCDQTIATTKPSLLFPSFPYRHDYPVHFHGRATAILAL